MSSKKRSRFYLYSNGSISICYYGCSQTFCSGGQNFPGAMDKKQKHTLGSRYRAKLLLSVQRYQAVLGPL